MRQVLCILEMLDSATPNACGYLRLFLPLSKKVVADHFDVRFVGLDDIDNYSANIVITQRTAINTLPNATKLLTYCDRVGARLVFDLDDDLLSLPSQHPEVEYYNALKHVILRLIAEADEMWVSTAALAARYAAVASRIHIVPNQLDDRLWNIPSPSVLVSNGPIRFLYMGTSSHRPDFEQLVHPAFTQLRSEFGNKVELDLIGIFDEPERSDEWRILRRPPHTGKSYPSFATWLQSLPPYHIGLAPLLDCTFNNCKSDVKWLEYSALGLATIAVNLPAYNLSIEHRRTGWLAEPETSSFLAAMRHLANDDALRQSLQHQAVQTASKILRLSSIAEPRINRLLELADSERPVAKMKRIGEDIATEFEGRRDFLRLCEGMK